MSTCFFLVWELFDVSVLLLSSLGFLLLQDLDLLQNEVLLQDTDQRIVDRVHE